MYPDDVQPVDVIIGRTFTDLDHIVYYKVGDTLTLAYRSEMVFPELTGETSNNNNMVCLEKCAVEPNSMMFLDVKLDDGVYCMPALNVGNRKTINEGDRLRETKL